MNTDRIICFLKALILSLIGLNIKTVKEAQDKGLYHCANVFGNGVNAIGCRSLWADRYGNHYKCNQLLDGRWEQITDGMLFVQKIFADEAMRQIQFTGSKTILNYNQPDEETLNVYYTKGELEGEEIYVLL
jgi:hypothetical protein